LNQGRKGALLACPLNLFWARDTNEKDAELPRDMVANNILYFDPTQAVYYPQGKSYQWGIRLYFEQ
jgi:hypothetical protein